MSTGNTAQHPWRPLSPLPNADPARGHPDTAEVQGEKVPSTHTHTDTHIHTGCPDTAEVQGERMPSTYPHIHTGHPDTA